MTIPKRNRSERTDHASSYPDAAEAEGQLRRRRRLRTRIDSIYAALKNGADFADLAKRLSQDPGSAKDGGVLPWIGPGQTVKEFEDQAYALQKGEMSQPFQSPFGYHIILMKDRKQLEPFDSLKNDILRFIEARGGKERVADVAIKETAEKQRHHHGTADGEPCCRNVCQRHGSKESDS